MADLLAQGVSTTLSLGPFVSATDADTILPALTITQADIQRSVNGGAFAPTNAAGGGVAQGLGYYAIPLDATDTGTLGLLRVSIQILGALPVWLDALIVPADVFTRLQGLTSAPVVLAGSGPTLAVGPFISISDGSTVLSALSVTQVNIQLSKAHGTPAQTTNPAGAPPLTFGHYAVTLTSADTDTPAPLRIQIDPPSALPVWMDVMVVTQAVWEIFYPVAPPVIVIPPGPSPSAPSGALIADDVLTRIAGHLDDDTMLHTTAPQLLRMLSRAEQWLALRYRLLVSTLPVEILPTVPWYRLWSPWPQVVAVTHVVDAQGVPLHPVPLSRLRYTNQAWLALSGTPTRYYRVGSTLLGLTPVPVAYGQVHVTALMAPRPLTMLTQRLQLPASYVDAVVEVAVGLALMSREHRYQEGLTRLLAGLGAQPQQPQQEAVA